MLKGAISLVLLLLATRAQGSLRLLDSDFGYGLYPSDFFGFGLRPLMNFPRLRFCPFETSMKEVAVENSHHVGKEGFQASLDVRGFEPNEITVKTVDDKIVIEAKHEEKEDDHGLISRHFIRRYVLPKGYDPNQVVSTLSSDGVLTVKAPAPPESESKPVERIVQVQQTGPAINNIKENSNSVPVEATQGQKDQKDNTVES